MGDLAKEAGVGRQTLYNVFRNKDDVLGALIRAYTEGHHPADGGMGGVPGA
ncbi:transcriptional regulator, TetR family [Bauldia litoralis]|uniref:Transcriptional regulator, TetR family n=2 Tax=Bauldia litoralis TaxID=665467 RepID=A0A1G6DJS8_9HYPH|nr:transcriptional regulator, TetR family [Bauldia litoralis]